MLALLMLFLCVILHTMSLGKSLQLLCILTVGMFAKIMCCCCCSPSETYGKKWSDSNFQILTELQVPPQAAGVVGTV